MLLLVFSVGSIRYATFLVVLDNRFVRELPLLLFDKPSLPFDAALDPRLDFLFNVGLGSKFFEKRLIRAENSEGVSLVVDNRETDAVRYIRQQSLGVSDLLQRYRYPSLWSLLSHLNILERNTDEFDVLKAWISRGSDVYQKDGLVPIARRGDRTEEDCLNLVCSYEKTNLLGFLYHLKIFYSDPIPALVNLSRCEDAAELAQMLSVRIVLMNSPRGGEIDLDVRKRKSRLMLTAAFLSDPRLCQDDEASAIRTLELIRDDFPAAVVADVSTLQTSDAFRPVIGYGRYLVAIRARQYAQAFAELSKISIGPTRSLLSELITLQAARVIFWAWQNAPETSGTLTVEPQSPFFKARSPGLSDRWTARQRGDPAAIVLARLAELQRLSGIAAFRTDIVEYDQIIRSAGSTGQ